MADAKARLIVTVDTEEAFDWDAGFSRNAWTVGGAGGLARVQALFDAWGICPAYVVDYPVIEDAEAVAMLRSTAQDGRCRIGAHLHPWVTPPYEETVDARHSYPGNLPPELEAAKIETLAGAIEDAFGARPRIYKAGRNGLGPGTGAILERLGFRIDTSLLAYSDLTADGGPDFSSVPPAPRRIGPGGRILAIPHTVGFIGRLAGAGPRLWPALSHPGVERVRLKGICARLGLLARVKLTPEGMPLGDLRRLLRRLARDGVTVFHLSFHSSSLVVGGSPYAASEQDIARLLDRLERLFACFRTDIGGTFARHEDLLDD